MSESPIEKEVVRLAEADGWFVRKLQWIGRRGAPDRLFVKAGRVVFIEFKAPGKPLQQLQVNERRRLTEHGAEAHYCDNVRTACHILGIPA